MGDAPAAPAEIVPVPVPEIVPVPVPDAPAALVPFPENPDAKESGAFVELALAHMVAHQAKANAVGVADRTRQSAVVLHHGVENTRRIVSHTIENSTRIQAGLTHDSMSLANAATQNSIQLMSQITVGSRKCEDVIKTHEVIEKITQDGIRTLMTSTAAASDTLVKTGQAAGREAVEQTRAQSDLFHSENLRAIQVTALAMKEASDTKKHVLTNESEAKKIAELAQIAVQEARSTAMHKDKLNVLEQNRIASELAAKLKSDEKQENDLEAAFSRYMGQYNDELATATKESQRFKNTIITKCPPKRVMTNGKLTNVEPGKVSWTFRS